MPENSTSVKRQVLFCPGPVNITQGVRSALLSGSEICHREPEFSELLQATRVKLLHALGLGGRYAVVLIPGSGTAALESGLMASVESGKKLLVLNNGVYGSRLAQLGRVHGISVIEIRSPLTERPDLNRVVAALKRDSRIGTVAMVHHETSTGLLNPIEAIGALVKKSRRRFFVDGISSLGAESIDLGKNYIQICVGSAGKALHGVPGLSFVLVDQAEVPRILKMKPKTLYLDLGLHFKSQETGDPPFTPAVPVVAAFHAAMNELNKEGLRVRVARYRQRANFLRDGFDKMGLKLLLDKKLLSNSLTAFWLPKGLTYQKFHGTLKKAGFVISAGQSELKGKIFRVAHMGQLLQADLKTFLKVTKDFINTIEASKPS